MDREKVKKGLEWILDGDRFGFGENWHIDSEPKSEEEQAGYYIQRAIELLKEQENDIHHMGLIIEEYEKELKEQEPLEPYACEGDMKCGNGCEIVGYIRESDGKIERLANYCPYCGRPVKWD